MTNLTHLSLALVALTLASLPALAGSQPSESRPSVVFFGTAQVPRTYTGDDGSLYLGSRDGLITALNRKTGATLWSFQGPARLDDLAVSAGTLLSADRVGITAFDKLSGKVLWKCAPVATYPYNGVIHHDLEGILGEMQVVEGVLYYLSKSQILRAVDVSSGQVLWARGGANANEFFVTPDRVYLDQGRSILDPKTGQSVWAMPFGFGTVVSKPVFGDNTVLLGSVDGLLMAMNSKTLQRLWIAHGSSCKTHYTIVNDEILDCPYNIMKHGLAVSDHLLVAAGQGGGEPQGFDPGRLMAFDVATGREVWHVQGPGSGAGSVSEPLIYKNLVITVMDSYAYGFDLTTGKRAWEFELPSKLATREPREFYIPLDLEGAPVLVDGILYLSQTDDSGETFVYGVDATTGLSVTPVNEVQNCSDQSWGPQKCMHWIGHAN